ncbi:hypothetical protein VP01_2960g3 [Puccinia sorghi]|uniref:Uncharacterized protein n=1 Tax=Puccinia sorghi TaxID=27349 RepID=A0A0L6V1M6_9BASI|nr:hypothetical protein VP01_2960g3 [Puccinia sorghi]
MLRTWGLVQKQALAILLARCDRQFFNGQAMIEDIDNQHIRLPTKDEVEQLRVSIATQGEAAANQLLNAETAAP